MTKNRFKQLLKEFLVECIHNPDLSLDNGLKSFHDVIEDFILKNENEFD